MTKLRQNLANGSLAIIGDVHGEIDALRALLQHLGVDTEATSSPRTLVFVGDFVDRGPDSVAVVELISRLIDRGIAVAVLGNHELNLLRQQHKSGNEWFWPAASEAQGELPQRRANEAERAAALALFASLPLVLERSDLQIVHACATALSSLPEDGPVVDRCAENEARIRKQFSTEDLARAKAGKEALRTSTAPGWSPDIEANSLYEAKVQNDNPVKVATSGRETAVAAKVSFVDEGGHWRAVDRSAWWRDWTGKPTVVGHYWRKRDPDKQTGVFAGMGPFDWCNSVFCVDYSVGLRFKERAGGKTDGFSHGLAALLWPERTLVFDDGSTQATFGFAAAQATGR